MGRRVKYLPSLPAIALVGGCASLTHDIGQPLDLGAPESYSAGTHYSEVLDRLGPPTKLSALPEGMVFLYERIELSERQYGLILPGEIGRWIKAVFASADADVDVMLFVFGRNGELIGADTEEWRADAGGGISMTLVVSAGSLTNTEQYDASGTRSLGWGKGLLLTSFRALNRSSSLETGANGVQLTTSPDGIGQHTLELKE